MKLLSLARDLQRRKARERHQLFLAEGVRAVETLLASPLEVRGLLVTASIADEARGRQLKQAAEERGVPVAEVSDKELDSASDTESPQGVVAVAAIPQYELLSPPATARYLVLDALQDPGNVGTVIRTAAALGVQGTVALPGTVDLWNPKVVRSSMGAAFIHPVLSLPLASLREFLAAHGVALWAADMAGDSLDSVAREALPGRLALAVSNEGAGLSPEVAESVQRTVCIPMTQSVESLNVAVATGILLHTLRASHPHS